MLQKVQDITTPDMSKGLNTQQNTLNIQKNQFPNMMDVKVNYDGSIEKRLGSNTMNSVVITDSGAASFLVDSDGTLKAGTASWWNMEEPSGARKDSLGGNSLADGNLTSYAGGIRGTAAKFVAANSNYLIKDSNSSLETGDENFSMSAWFYLSSTSKTKEQTIIAKKDLSISPDITFLCHADGLNASTAFTDNSVNNLTITASGNAQISTALTKFGSGSARFDGAGDSIYMADNALWDFGTGDFTIDFWTYIAGGDLDNGVAFFAHDQNGTNYYSLGIAGGSVLRWYALTAGAETINMAWSWSPNFKQWYHLALVRSSNVHDMYVDGVSLGRQTDATAVPTLSGNFYWGRGYSTGSTVKQLSGNLEEMRIVKGTAKWTTNFAAPTTSYSNPVTMSNYEYWLYVNTDQVVTFKVSSSGTTYNGSVSASSFGAVTTATWYSVVAWHNTANFIGLDVNLSINSATYADGVRAGSAAFAVGAVSNGQDACFDGRIDSVGFWKKLLTTQQRSDIYNAGSGNTYTSSFDRYPWASFDFGASSLRWLVVSAGTGIYASSNLGVSWVAMATDRSATYQYLSRSKNVLVATSDAYDQALAWPGSSGTYATVLNHSAPLCKYNINFNGYLILLNSSVSKKSFNYIDENLQMTGSGWLNFDIPSSADDEITAVFILRRYLYVSTRYSLYRVSYVGGNPDWSYVLIKNWGFMPRTVKTITLTSNQQQGAGFYYSIGEVAIGLTFDKKLRIFDGSGDQIISNSVEMDNQQCEFFFNNLAYYGSGPVISFSEIDPIQNVYKLCVAIGQNSSQTSHFLNFDGRAMSLYPYQNMKFNCMCMAESSNQRFLMAFDRAGYCHMMDSGNLDGNTTPINDVVDFPLFFEKTPAQTSKGYQTSLFFKNTTSGNVYLQERLDFGNTFKTNKVICLNGSDQKILIHETIDVPQTYNTYQMRLTSSSGTNTPWCLTRYDHFNKGLGIGRND